MRWLRPRPQTVSGFQAMPIASASIAVIALVWDIAISWFQTSPSPRPEVGTYTAGPGQRVLDEGLVDAL